MTSSAGSLMTCGRIGRTLPAQALGEIPALAVARALDAWVWAMDHGRDPLESMHRARVAFRMSSPHGRSLGLAYHGEINRRCLLRFTDYEVPSRVAMRAALELDVALTLDEQARDRQHVRAREESERQAAAMLRLRAGLES